MSFEEWYTDVVRCDSDDRGKFAVIVRPDQRFESSVDVESRIIEDNRSLLDYIFDPYKFKREVDEKRNEVARQVKEQIRRYKNK